MHDIIANFHFLRPVWFYALIPAVALFLVLRSRYARSSNWEKTIDADLLPYLLEAPGRHVRKNPMLLLLIAWILASIALAGPVWQKKPQPVHEREDALVVILDLTRSMYAVDVKPNRLVRARRKLLDLLESRKEGVTALVVFAGDAHTVSPLTDDTRTIAEMVPALGPEIMPAPGSQLAPALQLAYRLFKDGGVATGRILIITDEIRDVAESQSIAREHRFDYPISVLSVGTAEGAPISADHLEPDGGYLKDRNGALIIPRLDAASLQSFAQVAGGRYSPMTLTDEDLDYLLADEPLPEREQFRTLERDFDVWVEEGPWLLLLLLPLAALAFRRGWIWMLPLIMILPSERADASWWDDLWHTRDQQAAEAMQDGDAARAAELFDDPAWRATAHYRGKDYANAAKSWANIDTGDGRYNLGNALARDGKYEEAIKAYDESLAKDPDDEDAAFNKKLVEQLLQQQKQQQNQQQQKNSGDRKKQDQQNQQQQQDQGTQQDQGQQQQSEADKQKQEEEQQKQQQQDNAEQDKEQADKEQAQQQQAKADDDSLSDEQRQALQQWLRRVPDDPGGLLRRKFEMQHRERLKEGKTGPDDTRSNW
jgi:Ca-activated chloride channel family protein